MVTVESLSLSVALSLVQVKHTSSLDSEEVVESESSDSVSDSVADVVDTKIVSYTVVAALVP